MTHIVYDPCGLVSADEKTGAPRVKALKGLRLGVLDNSKWNAMALLRDTANTLQEASGFKEIKYYRKNAFSVPATPELLEEIAASSDVVITAIGDCGSCTSCCTGDAVQLEIMGVPTAVIVTTEFVHESKMQSAALGMAALEQIVIEHPLSTLSADAIMARARQAAPQAQKIWLGEA